MTAGRTYLSIGDVLTLLRQEFPDVTISKIRFLESQGLVNPERTPSGYRKFYDHDVERLRWVLRQQREHFLPLKVIKGRLEDESSGSEEADAMGNGRAGGESGVRSPAESPAGLKDGGVQQISRAGAVGLDDRSQGETSLRHGASDRDLEVPGHLPGFDPPAGGELLERHLAGEASGQHAGGSGRVQHARPGQSGASRPLATNATGTATRTHGAQPESPYGGGLKSEWAGSVGVQEPAGSTDDRYARGSQASRPGAHEGAAAREATVKGSDKAAVEPGPGPGRLTLAEIAAGAGLTESTVQDLESYGILSSRIVGGVAHFDESELAIARVAADFAKFGIEPRHLRLYKHASEREAGFVEQLVLPLLKQRNPEARKRAAEMVSDLTRLGEGLRQAMVTRNLQDLLGG